MTFFGALAVVAMTALMLACDNGEADTVTVKDARFMSQLPAGWARTGESGTNPRTVVFSDGDLRRLEVKVWTEGAPILMEDTGGSLSFYSDELWRLTWADQSRTKFLIGSAGTRCDKPSQFCTIENGRLDLGATHIESESPVVRGIRFTFEFTDKGGVRYPV